MDIQQIREFFQVPQSLAVILGIPYGRAVKASGNGRLYARVGVLHHQTIMREKADHTRCFQEHLRMGLGVGDAIAVCHSVKEAAQADALQDKRRIPAGRA